MGNKKEAAQSATKESLDIIDQMMEQLKTESDRRLRADLKAITFGRRYETPVHELGPQLGSSLGQLLKGNEKGSGTFTPRNPFLPGPAFEEPQGEPVDKLKQLMSHGLRPEKLMMHPQTFEDMCREFGRPDSVGKNCALEFKTIKARKGSIGELIKKWKDEGVKQLGTPPSVIADLMEAYSGREVAAQMCHDINYAGKLTWHGIDLIPVPGIERDRCYGIRMMTEEEALRLKEAKPVRFCFQPDRTMTGSIRGHKADMVIVDEIKEFETAEELQRKSLADMHLAGMISDTTLLKEFGIDPGERGDSMNRTEELRRQTRLRQFGEYSDWEDLDGDPRIIKGTTVRLCKHRDLGSGKGANWNHEREHVVGRLAEVIDEHGSNRESGIGYVSIRVDHMESWWRRRDMVLEVPVTCCAGGCTEDAVHSTIFNGTQNSGLCQAHLDALKGSPTGRISSKEPNIQELPRPGVDVDYGPIEKRLAAHHAAVVDRMQRETIKRDLDRGSVPAYREGPSYYVSASADLERMKALAAERGLPLMMAAQQALYSHYCDRHPEQQQLVPTRSNAIAKELEKGEQPRSLEETAEYLRERFRDMGTAGPSGNAMIDSLMAKVREIERQNARAAERKYLGELSEDMTITQIIENNSLKDIRAIEDKHFMDLIMAEERRVKDRAKRDLEAVKPRLAERGFPTAPIPEPSPVVSPAPKKVPYTKGDHMGCAANHQREEARALDRHEENGTVYVRVGGKFTEATLDKVNGCIIRKGVVYMPQSEYYRLMDGPPPDHSGERMLRGFQDWLKKPLTTGPGK